MWRQWLPVTAATLALSACNPYSRFTGDSSAGAVDPVNFPAAYLGTGGDGKHPGMGVLMASLATDDVSGNTVGYYPFPFTGFDLAVALPGADNVTQEYVAPLGYDFDEDGTTHCKVPKNYEYDQQRDDVRYDEQGDIFTSIPDQALFPDYQPIVADVPVQSGASYPCQAVKSDDRLVKRKDVTFPTGLVPPLNPNVPGQHPEGAPSKKLYARPVIDPSIDVHFPDGSLDPNTGLGPQHWGWYARYLIAWLDGGLIPTMQSTVTDQNGNMQTITEMQTQVLYFPDSHPGTDAGGNPVIVQGGPGDGYDIITAGRDETGFSPLCEVYVFTPKDPTMPETSIADIDMSTAQSTGQFIWCIQLPAQVQ